MAWPNDVRRSDLRVDTYRGSGNGGQKRNKTDSAVRITHLPTGIVAQCESHVSQHRNRANAFKLLAARLVPIMRGEADQPMGRYVDGERIRTYHEPDNRVTDHRTGKRYAWAKVVRGSGIAEVMADCHRELSVKD